MNNQVHKLNKLYGTSDILTFEQSKNGLISAVVHNTLASGRVYLHGAHVTHFQPKGQEPVVWLSEKSLFVPGKAIRGGVPICWPWFGDHPNDPEKPAHGFARTALWEILNTESLEDGTTNITLGLSDTPTTRDLWNHRFNLQLTVSFATILQLSLEIINNGESSFTCSGALHSYLRIGDCKDITIHGLDGLTYLDKVDNLREKIQHGLVTIQEETDRIYLNTTAPCTIKDPALQRTLKVHKKGSNTTVIWNPGEEKSLTMKDMDDSGYKTMVCVESVNAREDSVTLQPGTKHTLQTEIEILKP